MAEDMTPRETLLSVIEGSGVDGPGMHAVAAALNVYRDSLYVGLVEDLRSTAAQVSEICTATTGGHPEDDDCQLCNIAGVYRDVADVIAAGRS